MARLDQATSAFNRIYERQTGLSAMSRDANIEQAGKLKELEDLVRFNKIEERLAQLKAGNP
jgi:phage shock protein A